MRFYAPLMSGASVKSTAQHFFKKLLSQYGELNTLDLCMTANFINDIMRMIGLRCSFTAEDLSSHNRSQSSESEFNWPDFRNYAFQYNSVSFRRLEEFLVVLSEVVFECNEEHLEQLETNDISDDTTWPVEVYMYLLALWCAACRDLLNTDHNEKPCFEEPLARINYHLLLGVHKLRMEYCTALPTLHKVCDRLYRCALKGIFYRQAHQCIMLGLLQIFEKNFIVFQQTAPDAMDFFYEAFSVQDQTKTYILIYKRLRYMLIYHSENQGNDASQISMSNKLLILTNCLISEKMLNVYYNHLRFEKSKRLLVAVVQFLETLQGKLPSLDCFPQTLIETILAVVLASDSSINSAAAQLYITIMRRKLCDSLILKHLIDYYASNQKSSQLVDHYVNSFWPHFPFMRSSDPYLNIITQTRNKTLRHFTAHILINVFKQLLHDIDTYHRTVAKTLYNLPQFLDGLNCAATRNILLGILSAIDFDQVGKYISHFQQFLFEFEQYATKNIMRNFHYDFYAQWNLFTQYHRCIAYTSNWDSLEELVNNVYFRFRRLEQQFHHSITNNELPNMEFIREYKKSLQDLHIVLKLDYQMLDYLNELYHSLKKHLIEKPNIMNVTGSSNLLIDVHAIEILTSCIMKSMQATGIGVDECYKWCLESRILLQYLFSHLQYADENELIQQPFVRLSTIFNCIIVIYCLFSDNNITYTLKLEMRAYNILVNVLILLTFKTPIKNLNCIDCNGDLMESERIYELQKIMLKYFIRLHATPTVEIPANIVWKRNQIRFKNELSALLCTLATDRYDIYKHCLAVLVYNLHKQQPPLSNNDIMAATNSHERLIEFREMNIEEPALLRVHIVLVVLQIIEKSLKVIDLNIQYNRLAPLKYLNIFTKPLIVNSRNVLTDIRRQAQILKHYPLTATEETELERFQSHYQELN